LSRSRPSTDGQTARVAVSNGCQIGSRAICAS